MCVSLARSAFARILSVDTEKAVTSAGQSSLRASLLSKLVTAHFDDEQHPADHQALLMYVLADFQERYEIAIRWLYSLLAADTRRSKHHPHHRHRAALPLPSSHDREAVTDEDTQTNNNSGADNNSSDEHDKATAITNGNGNDNDNSHHNSNEYDNYTSILSSILSGLESALDPSDTLFSTFLVDIPYVPSCVYDTLARYCQQADTRALGLSSLRDLVLDRLPARKRALSMLLGRLPYRSLVIYLFSQSLLFPSF
jgi:hypothetical protein